MLLSHRDMETQYILLQLIYLHFDAHYTTHLKSVLHGLRT